MAQTASTMMLPLGATAPPFELPDPSGRTFSLAGFDGSAGLLLAFICKHCPFVKHVRTGFALLAAEYGARGVAVVAIASNDAQAYPEDGPDGMAEEARAAGYTFPYLFDESQEVAKAYGAACTPDFFLFDRARRLVYRGHFDASRPSSKIPVTGADLRAAADAVLAGAAVSADQKPSIGCNIKWKPGNAPDYA